MLDDDRWSREASKLHGHVDEQVIFGALPELLHDIDAARASLWRKAGDADRQVEAWRDGAELLDGTAMLQAYSDVANQWADESAEEAGFRMDLERAEASLQAASEALQKLDQYGQSFIANYKLAKLANAVTALARAECDGDARHWRP